jgi:hypothetical protein
LDKLTSNGAGREIESFRLPTPTIIRGNTIPSPVYPPCTSLRRKEPFQRFLRFEESASYNVSREGDSSNPTAS